MEFPSTKYDMAATMESVPRALAMRCAACRRRVDPRTWLRKKGCSPFFRPNAAATQSGGKSVPGMGQAKDVSFCSPSCLSQPALSSGTEAPGRRRASDREAGMSKVEKAPPYVASRRRLRTSRARKCGRTSPSEGLFNAGDSPNTKATAVRTAGRTNTMTRTSKRNRARSSTPPSTFPRAEEAPVPCLLLGSFLDPTAELPPRRFFPITRTRCRRVESSVSTPKLLSGYPRLRSLAPLVVYSGPTRDKYMHVPVFF
mmetsp:Transcript_23215/g.68629  ORF Transcript_23215/g.68629 Transcript_23215/m.68629 type:complete len:256 (-) Transcript_23215:59-826(-)